MRSAMRPAMNARLPLALAVSMLASALATAPVPARAAPKDAVKDAPKEAVKEAAKDAKDGKDKAASPFGSLGGGGKEPIKIDADRLDVFDKENKAVFAGNVVAVQGDATIRCSALTVYYRRDQKDGKADGKGEGKGDAKGDAKGGDAAEKSPSAMAENGIQKVDCAGPVTVVQKDQVATGDNAVFDQVAKRIVLTGNVVLSQCQNVTRGSRLVYDMNTGRANMDPGANGRVSAMFVPGEKAEDKGAGAKGAANGAAKGCAQPPGVAAKTKSNEPKSNEKTAEGEDRPADKASSKPSPKARAQAN